MWVYLSFESQVVFDTNKEQSTTHIHYIVKVTSPEMNPKSKVADWISHYKNISRYASMLISSKLRVLHLLSATEIFMSLSAWLKEINKQKELSERWMNVELLINHCKFVQNWG